MRTHDLFRQDCAEILREQYKARRISKRDFLKGSAALGVSAAALAAGLRPTRAADGITIANYGGDAIRAYNEAFVERFTAETGIPVEIDGTGPIVGRIRKMIDDGQVVWDVADGADYYSARLGEEYLLPIDYDVVDPEKYYSWNKFPYAAGSYTYSNVLAYDSSKFDEAPSSWADFFDLEKFPGKRALYKWFDNQPEIFMLAAGRAPEDIYPIDMDLVVDMVRKLGDNLVLWDSGGLSQQLFFSGEVVMGNIWNTRANTLNRDTDGRVKWLWNQQIMTSAAWVILKGCSDPVAAQQFIASTQDPEGQIKLLQSMGNGPANPAAEALMDDAMRAINPASHMESAITHDVDWYAKHKDDALYTWLDAVS